MNEQSAGTSSTRLAGQLPVMPGVTWQRLARSISGLMWRPLKKEGTQTATGLFAFLFSVSISFMFIPLAGLPGVFKRQHLL